MGYLALGLKLDNDEEKNRGKTRETCVRKPHGATARGWRETDRAKARWNGKLRGSLGAGL